MRVIDFIDVDEEDEMPEKLRFLQKNCYRIGVYEQILSAFLVV